MNRIILVLIVMLIILGGVSYYAVMNIRTTTLNSQTNTATVSDGTEAVLSFTPAEITLDKNTRTYSTDIVIDSGANKVTGAQIELGFDPKVIETIDLSEPQGESYFFNGITTTELPYRSDVSKGKLMYAVGITPNQPSKTGNGVIAHVTFTVKPGVTATPSSITFLPRTLVTEEGTTTSVLDSTKPLKLVVK